MATRAAVGESTLRNSEEAGAAAASAAMRALGVRADSALVFATSGYDQRALLRGVRSGLPNTRIAGCSGEGVITQGQSRETDFAVAVMALQSDSMTFDPYLLNSYSDDPAGRGAQLAARITSQAANDVVCLLAFPDGLRGNCTEFLSSLHEALPFPVLVAGGTSADAMTFERTYQYADDSVATDAISGVLVRGRGRVQVAVSHGCAPIGLERTVTRAEAGWVYEIDGRPAWSVFKEYLSGDPEDLSAEGTSHLCIGMPLTEPSTDYAPIVIRTPLRPDKDNGALFFPGGGLSANQSIRLTRRDPVLIRDSARSCAQRIHDQSRGEAPALVLQFDCAGRGKAVFGDCVADEIVVPLQESLGSNIPWIGFHTYGEIAPISSRPHYHNYTVALCAFYEQD